MFVLICEASFLIFTLLFTYREFKKLLETDLKEYMTAFWTWVEIALLGLSWTSIVLCLIRFGLNKLTKKAFRENPQEFVDFHHRSTCIVTLIQKVHCDDNKEDFLRNDGEVTYLIPDIKLESYA